MTDEEIREQIRKRLHEKAAKEPFQTLKEPNGRTRSVSELPDGAKAERPWVVL